jgi:hypothetical protein
MEDRLSSHFGFSLSEKLMDLLLESLGTFCDEFGEELVGMKYQY